MLIISREIGEALLILDIVVIVVRVERNSAEISLQKAAGGKRVSTILSRSKFVDGCYNTRIVLVETRGTKARLGIEAPKDLPIHRYEVCDSQADNPIQRELKPEYLVYPKAGIAPDFYESLGRNILDLADVYEINTLAGICDLLAGEQPRPLIFQVLSEQSKRQRSDIPPNEREKITEFVRRKWGEHADGRCIMCCNQTIQQLASHTAVDTIEVVQPGTK